MAVFKNDHFGIYLVCSRDCVNVSTLWWEGATAMQKTVSLKVEEGVSASLAVSPSALVGETIWRFVV